MAKLFTFGGGALGELGTDRAFYAIRPDATPVAFPPVADGFPIQDFAVGSDHSVAVVGGCVYWWGLWGAHGKLETGRGKPVGESFKPEVVPLPTSMVDLIAPEKLRESKYAARGCVLDETNNFPDGHIHGVVCGGSNCFFLTDEGEVFVLGSLRHLGGNPNAVRHLWGSSIGGPFTRVKSIAAGWRHCLLLTEAGYVFALGDDEHGQCAGEPNGASALVLPSSCESVGVAAGACHSVAWDCSGAVYSWGHAGSGRLGLGEGHHQRAPLRVPKVPQSVCAAACGANFTMFITSSRLALWSCGGNQFGQLGLGDCDQRAQEVPTKLGFPYRGEEILSLACGANHVLCLTRLPSSGGPAHRAVVWAWGCASSGQCGWADGEQRSSRQPSHRGSPEAVADFLSPVPHWAIAVAAGRIHSAVLAAPDAVVSKLSPRSVEAARIIDHQTHLEREEDIIDSFCAGLGGHCTEYPGRAFGDRRASQLLELAEEILESRRQVLNKNSAKTVRGNAYVSAKRAARLTQTARESAERESHWPNTQSNTGKRRSPVKVVDRRFLGGDARNGWTDNNFAVPTMDDGSCLETKFLGPALHDDGHFSDNDSAFHGIDYDWQPWVKSRSTILEHHNHSRYRGIPTGQSRPRMIRPNRFSPRGRQHENSLAVEAFFEQGFSGDDRSDDALDFSPRSITSSGAKPHDARRNRTASERNADVVLQPSLHEVNGDHARVSRGNETSPRNVAIAPQSFEFDTRQGYVQAVEDTMPSPLSPSQQRSHESIASNSYPVHAQPMELDTTSSTLVQLSQRSASLKSNVAITQPSDSQKRSSLISRSFGGDESGDLGIATTRIDDVEATTSHVAEGIMTTPPIRVEATLSANGTVSEDRQESDATSSESSESSSDEAEGRESPVIAPEMAPTATLGDDSMPSLPDEDEDPPDVDALLDGLQSSASTSESDIEANFPGLDDNEDEGDWV